MIISKLKLLLACGTSSAALLHRSIIIQLRLAVLYLMHHRFFKKALFMRSGIFTILILVFAFIDVKGQATFVVTQLPPSTPEDAVVYMAGTFNNWTPDDSQYTLEPNDDGLLQITLPAQSEGSQIQFKFTRGSWATVEKGPNGEEIANRVFTFGNGDTVPVIIYNWADTSSNSTAADNVMVLDNDFYMPQLDRYRRIWIYLPPEYLTDTTISFPVLYMQDGQNIFDAYTSFAGEWEVDETLNALAADGIPVPIVVAIDNGGSYRLDEYSPWVNSQYGGGQGEAYMQFIVETLKPFIDSEFRTLTGREYTGIMGSSLGGLISHFGALQYQDVFSKAGLFSPSYWFSDTVWTFTAETGKQLDMRLYQMTGGNEGGSQVDDAETMQAALFDAGFGENEIKTLIVPGGEHNEQLWRSQFEAAYLWLFADYINTGIAGKQIFITVRISPNPARDVLAVSGIEDTGRVEVKIMDVYGRQVMHLLPESISSIDISSLKPGGYIMLIISKNQTYSAGFIKQ